MVLGSEESPYVFTDRGYYEKYADEFEKDNKLEYGDDGYIVEIEPEE